MWKKKNKKAEGNKCTLCACILICKHAVAEYMLWSDGVQVSHSSPTSLASLLSTLEFLCFGIMAMAIMWPNSETTSGSSHLIMELSTATGSWPGPDSPSPLLLWILHASMTTCLNYAGIINEVKPYPPNWPRLSHAIYVHALLTLLQTVSGENPHDKLLHALSIIWACSQIWIIWTRLDQAKLVRNWLHQSQCMCSTHTVTILINKRIVLCAASLLFCSLAGCVLQ